MVNISYSIYLIGKKIKENGMDKRERERFSDYGKWKVTKTLWEDFGYLFAKMIYGKTSKQNGICNENIFMG